MTSATAGPDAGIPRRGPGSVITVGTFDGVHRGHWQVLRQVRRQADEVGGPGILVTFDPHPLRIVRPEAAPPLLTTPTEKMEILAESGLDYAVFLSFTPALREYTPERFVEDILLRRYRLKELVIGYDHGFGRGRSGDVDTLREIGARRDFGVHVVDPVQDGDEPISSTRIRDALEAGDMGEAARGLGRPYSLRGLVVRGDGRGRALGFATANIRAPHAEKLLPKSGVYAVRGVLPDGPHDGVLHLGPRPTFRGAPPSVELHLFDFERDVYGEEVRVDFHARLRDIHPFRTPDELIAAIREDCREAQRLLRAGAPAPDGRA